eukprot:4604956-Pyramimonas_sp.AAC.1
MGPHAFSQQGGYNPSKGRSLSLSYVANFTFRTCQAVMDSCRTRQHVRGRMSFSLIRMRRSTT